MLITVKTKPNSKISSVRKINDGSFLVRVDVPARDGKANRRLQEILAQHFAVPKNCVRIKRGHRARIKIVEIV